MKKTAKKLISALLVLAMVISTFSPAAIAAPATGKNNAVVETTPAADNSVGETADTLLAAASALASIEESSGNVHKISKEEIEEDALLKRADAELKKAGFTEEQNQQLLYFFSEYKKVISGNPDVFGVEAPYFLDKDTNERPIESLLAQVGYTQQSLEAAVEAGEQTFDEVLGMVQLFYYAAEFGVQMLGDQVKAARDEALSVINDNMTDVEKILALNDWIAAYSQFDWSQLLPIKAPQQELAELAQQIYPIMYDQIKQQVYDGAKNDLLSNGISEENADIYATAAAESYMDDVAEDGGKNGNTAALEVAGGVYSLWGTMVFGPLALKNAVCIGYSNAFAYLVQSMYPEIYKNSDGTWKTPDQVNVDANGKHENAPYVVDFVRIQFSDTISLFGSPAGSFSSFHFWNALKVNGKWYYVDSCYTDIYVACMLRDRVETEGNMNHVYFMFSHDSCEDMYDGYYSEIDSLYGNANNSKLYAGDKTYEDAWFAFAKSPVIRQGNYYYYAYDSTDIFEMMSMMNNYNSNGNTRSVSESGNTKAAEGDNNNNWGNNNWNNNMSNWQDSEYKLVRRKVSLKDSTDDFEELINFNEGTVLNLESGEMEANDLIKTFYAKHEEDAKIYPSLVITTAYYNNVLYFNLSNDVFSYDLKTGAVNRVLEYNKVMGKRDPSKAFGGLAMTKTTDASEAAITVNNAPIAAIAIKDGDLIVSVATTYGLISGKEPYPPENPKEGDEEKTAMDFYSSYGYFFAETNYNSDYQSSKFGYGDETNDNDEFMWSANIIDTISMSHLAGGSHSYKNVTVPESCITDAYSEQRCSTCGKIQDGSDTPMLISEIADTKADGEEGSEESGESTESEGSTVEPTTTEPETVEPTTVEPTTVEPTTVEPTTVEPTTVEPTTVEPTTVEPTTVEPTTVEPTTVEPTTVEPTTVAPTTTEPETEAPTTTEPETEAPKADAKVVLTIRIEGKDGASLGSTTLEATGKEGDKYTFTASQIADKAKSVSLDGYAVDASTAKEVTGTYKAGDNTASTTVQADRVYADAKVVLTIKIVGKDGTDLNKSTTLEKSGKEEDKYTFTAEEIAEAAKKVSLDGYTVDASTAKEVTGTYKAGDNTASTTVEADKHVVATLTISIINSSTAEDDEPEVLGTVTLTKEGVSGEKATFTADEIKKAAEEAEIGDYTVDTTNKYADTEVEYSKEKTVTVTATKNLHGHGHRYIKFSESYYTRKDGVADDDVRDSAFNKGTCYVCLDCMKAYEEADFTADVRTERDTIYDYQKELSGKKYAYWTWSSDGTEAALFLIPEELKSIMLDCVWENRLFSSRTEVTPQVTGMANNCTTGLQLTYTATVTVNGTKYSDTRTITYPEMAHSETLTWTWDLDEEGNVKPLTDANGNLTCAAPSLKLTCNTCGTSTDVETTIITQTNPATCTYPGLTFFMATGKNGERNYADMQMMISAAPLGHDYGDDDFCDRIVDAEGHTCGTERIASTVTLANKTATYTGEAISAPTAKVEGSEGKVTYTYYSDKDCKKALSGAPVKPGVYYVKAKVTAAGDYKAATSKAAKLTINPRSAGTPKVANTSDGIKVSWAKVDEAVGYRVYRKSKSSDSWTRVATIEKNSTLSWTNTTKDEKYPVKSGNTYIYTVRAYVNDSCLSSYDKTGVSMQYLSQPTVTVANAKKGITVKWKKVSGAAGYRVYRKETASDKWVSVAKITKNSTVSWTNTTTDEKNPVKAGKTYIYTVKAYGEGSYLSSYNATGVKMKYLSQPAVSVKNVTEGVTIRWKKITGASGYYVYYRTSTKDKWTCIKTIKDASTVSYTYKKANTNGKKYYFTVKAYSGDYKSSFASKTYYRLSKPSISSVKNSSSKKLTVKWKKNSKATGYEFEYSTDSKFKNAKKTTVKGAATLSKAVSVTKGKTYYVRLRTYKTVDDVKYYSAWSSSKKLKISK